MNRKEILLHSAKDSDCFSRGPCRDSNLTPDQYDFLRYIAGRILEYSGGATLEAKRLLGEVKASLIRIGDIPDMGYMTVENTRDGQPGYIFFDRHLEYELTDEEKMILALTLPPFSENHEYDDPGVSPIDETLPVPVWPDDIRTFKASELPASAYSLSGPTGFMVHEAWRYICHRAVSMNLKDHVFLPLIEKIIGVFMKLDRVMANIEKNRSMSPPLHSLPPLVELFNRKGILKLMQIYKANQDSSHDSEKFLKKINYIK